jgi:N,N'-diacetyllegionaminate synthase
MAEKPIYIIAEMAYSHDGSPDLARDIAAKAAASGADAISVHFTHMPDYMVRHYGAGPGRVSAGKDVKPIYEYLEEISLSFDDWRSVAGAIEKTGMDLIVMPNDNASFEFAETLSPDAYVLSAACFEEREFISRVGASGKPVYLRVGGATLGEIETVIGVLKDAGAEDLILLYGHQNYPTGPADTNLAALTRLQQSFGLPVGIAEHVDAEDEFAVIAPLLAIPLGVVAIEKHLTHDRGKRGEDFESALNGDEFEAFVNNVRKAESAIGRGEIGTDESSALYRKNVRKRLVAATAISAGQIISDDQVAAKRSDEGLSPGRRADIVGRVAIEDIAPDTGLTLDMTEPSA